VNSAWLRQGLRVVVIGLLTAAPFAFGAVEPWAYFSLIGIAAATGVLSWAHAHWARSHGVQVARVPQTRLLVALIALVAIQIVPLPPAWLSRLSPGSFQYYDFLSLVPVRTWHSISVSPVNTARGLLFLVAMSLLYATVVRDFQESRWRRRLAAAVVVAASVMTVEALIQAGSHDPTRIYGIWKPTWDWAVFGPYVSKNSFAGYVVMAIPLAMAWAGQSLGELREKWRRRRVGWVALGDREGTAMIRSSALVALLIVGLIASRSRGGIMAFVLSALAVPLLLRRRRWAIAAAITLLAGAVVVVALKDVDLAKGAERGLRDSRFAVWQDAIRMAPDFPALGSGLNTFGTIYRRYQRVWPSIWFGEAHNEYLQILIETGVAGFSLFGILLWRLLRTAHGNATQGVIHSGVFGGLLALSFHNLVDFNWQIPANAATFAALAGLAMQEPRLRSRRLDSAEQPRLESASLG
jgi:O-antigen ligase